MANDYIWLKHLDGSVPIDAYGYPISMYCIALEGWRRGLTLRFKNNLRVKAVTPYVLSGYGREIEFKGTRSTLVSNKAIRTCMNKDRTKECLKRSNVSIPEGKVFTDHTNEEVISKVKGLVYPLVVKPTDASGGKGVIANIKSETELKDALVYVRNKLSYKRIIVEEFFRGNDYRLYVVGDEVVGALYRYTANVVGDGKSSIKQLLNKKRRQRDRNPGLYNHVIKRDKEMKTLLKNQGYRLDSVPKDNEVVYLKTTSNISSGGDPVDVTDKIPDHIKAEAVRATKAIPGLIQAGVDILYNEESNKVAIIEINSQPSIRGHLFPLYGKARDVPKAIIDYYFPESKNKRVVEKPLFYFDIKSVFDPFQSYMLDEIKIPNLPLIAPEDFVNKEYNINGMFKHVPYSTWIRKQAKICKLYGNLKIVDDSNITLSVAGNKDTVNKFDNTIKNETPSRHKIKSIEESLVSYNEIKPIKVGFEIKDERTNK